MERFVAYYRVSSIQQGVSGLGIDAQRSAVLNYLKGELPIQEFTDIETGTKKPSERTIFDICEKFNVNQDWLRTGNGEMFVELSKDEQISAMLGEIQRLGDENFKYRLVSALCKLSESDWTALENLVDTISDKK